MSESKGNRGKGKRILADHKKVGKRFVPPLLQLSPMVDVSWTSCTLPELLWLGLLNDHFGLKKGSDLALSLAKAAVATKKKSKGISRWYALTSSYSFLEEENKELLVRSLKATGALDDLRLGLESLAALYPECPLSFLFEDALPNTTDKENTLETFKRFLRSLFDKRGTPAILAQANSVYIAFATDILKVVEGTALANFPAIADYPGTDESRIIGASICASVGAFVSFFLEDHSFGQNTPWSRYFWNKGLEIEACTFQGVYEL